MDYIPVGSWTSTYFEGNVAGGWLRNPWGLMADYRDFQVLKVLLIGVINKEKFLMTSQLRLDLV
jgi:hypothetical protein